MIVWPSSLKQSFKRESISFVTLLLFFFHIIILISSTHKNILFYFTFTIQCFFTALTCVCITTYDGLINAQSASLRSLVAAESREQRVFEIIMLAQ